VMGVAQSAATLARVLGPLLAGFLFDEFGRNAPYFAGAVLMAVVHYLVHRLRARRTPLPEAPAPKAPAR
jgi:DHA1 family tetracycline resistance protein-like MFS transporter